MYFFILIIFLSASPIFAGLTLESYRRMPGSWLCEWDAFPQDIHMPCCRYTHECRIWILLTVIYGVSLSTAIFILTGDSPSAKNEFNCVLISAEILYLCVVLFLLIIASMSDLKYMIIPDQVSAAVVLMSSLRCVTSSFFYASTLGESFYSGKFMNNQGDVFSDILLKPMISVVYDMLSAFKPLSVGALAAGGSAVFTVLISAAVYRRQTLGFGDIKLIAACGGLAGSFAAFSPLKFSEGTYYGLISPFEAGLMVYAGTIILSAIYFSIRILCGKLKTGDEMPLAPWISVSAVFTILALGIF
ncbi:MAG: hypothetical protein HFE90_00710 [Firmicutes bacterium]|nr:hypothetical protein [Bacillota bacterium]